MIITEYINKQGRNPCGSEYCQIFKTGKTEKIALNNLLSKKTFISKNIVSARIYKTSNLYNRESYNLLKTNNLK